MANHVCDWLAITQNGWKMADGQQLFCTLKRYGIVA